MNILKEADLNILRPAPFYFNLKGLMLIAQKF